MKNLTLLQREQYQKDCEKFWAYQDEEAKKEDEEFFEMQERLLNIHGRINVRANIVNKTMANHNFIQDEVFYFSLTIEGYKKYADLKEYTAFYGKRFYN